ncbi:MAG: hypothetical protein PHP56_10400 [Smithellaceae bacterium]|nr:hypothetical protein [Smithellaceae bacterium]HOQ72009.1 hypothetical protein [Smithellaceae bacterium]
MGGLPVLEQHLPLFILIMAKAQCKGNEDKEKKKGRSEPEDIQAAGQQGLTRGLLCFFRCHKAPCVPFDQAGKMADPFVSGCKETVSEPINFGRIMKTTPSNVKRQKRSKNGFLCVWQIQPGSVILPANSFQLLR